jgi:ATP-dependent DNA helicase RecQ
MSLPAVDTLSATLKNTFGYASFRPLQREIMEETLAGRDVLALLPTGGGKSLCYQLPAIVRAGLTVVISPLIALMKDQVDSLLQNGVKAAYLNSSLTDDESKDTWRQLFRGEIKVLYLSPERLLVEGMLDTLGQVIGEIHDDAGNVIITGSVTLAGER